VLSGCDECIWHLIGDLRQSNKTLDQLKVAVLNISSGAAANDRLKYYNYTALRLQVHTLMTCKNKKICIEDKLKLRPLIFANKHKQWIKYFFGVTCESCVRFFPSMSLSKEYISSFNRLSFKAGETSQP